MRWLKRRPNPGVLSSENGLFELSGRQQGLPLRDVVIHFRDLVSDDMAWADSRKSRYRGRAATVKVAALVLAALSTVILGIEAIPGRNQIALPMVAAVTVLGALETFFNWRSRWVVMEETRYRLNHLRDKIDYYLAVTPPDGVEREDLDKFFAEKQLIWSEVNRRWIEFRALEPSQPAGTSGPNY
jgi:hypothetical protein